MKILVIGGSGTVGSQVVLELLKRKVSVRVLTRTADTKLPDGVEAAIGDLLEPESLEKALEGVEKMYLLNKVSPDELTQALIAYNIARKSKLKHVVYHSVFHVEQFKDVPHFASKFAVESALREFGLPYTVIRPNYFHQNDARLKDLFLKMGVYPMPLGPIGVSSVDVRDIAEAAAIALTEPGHEGKYYNLNGPDVISGERAANIWSEALGKKITYMGHDLDAFEKQMRSQIPAWSAFDIRTMFGGYLDRGFSAEPADLRILTELLGHSPRRYVDFVRETVPAWKSELADRSNP